MLIRNAEIADGVVVDVRVDGARVAELGTALATHADDEVIDAAGGALMPGLHDHHIHLRALAASMASVRCGPPDVRVMTALAEALRVADHRSPGADWLRGIGFHESVGSGTDGALDRDVLDAMLPHRPVRIQHRSGRLWVFNSAALDLLAPDADAPLERVNGRWTGRLYDADDWLRSRLRGTPPSLHGVSRYLASRGVTGVTDTTHHNGPDELAAFADAHASGELLQHVRVMGDARLDTLHDLPQAQRGEHKFHLHDHDLPDFETLVTSIRTSHAHGRAVAFHCVTRGELVFALAAIREAGQLAGDRIEHASIAPPELMEDIARLKLTVVTQPNFIAERGDDYLRNVDAEDLPWLYRLRGFIDAGVRLALSTDAPFGEPDPWAAIAAAVSRATPSGAVIGHAERLSALEALHAFAGPLHAPGRRTSREFVVGDIADAFLLQRPLSVAGAFPSSAAIRATLIHGRMAYQAPHPDSRDPWKGWKDETGRHQSAALGGPTSADAEST